MKKCSLVLIFPSHPSFMLGIFKRGITDHTPEVTVSSMCIRFRRGKRERNRLGCAQTNNKLLRTNYVQDRLSYRNLTHVSTTTLNTSFTFVHQKFSKGLKSKPQNNYTIRQKKAFWVSLLLCCSCFVFTVVLLVWLIISTLLQLRVAYCCTTCGGQFSGWLGPKKL